MDPQEGLKETVNKSNESAPSQQGRAVAVWGLSLKLALGAFGLASTLSSRGFPHFFPHLPCSTPSPR